MNDSYGKWIPVSERLPEESLNSVIGWDTYRNRCCFVQYLGGRFVIGDDIDSVNVTAWMPLPEPYIEGENNPITNADVIRNMTDEELDKFLGDRCPFSCREVCEKYQHGCWEKCWTKNEELRLKWLKSENKRRL